MCLNRAVPWIVGILLVACSSSNHRSPAPGSSAIALSSPSHASASEVTRYAIQINGIIKAIHTCAWAEKNDIDFLSDNEAIAMCEGDNQSIDSYLSFAQPAGFADTQSQLRRLKHDLETHNQAAPLPHFQQETSDATLIVKAFTADLNATDLPRAMKQRILKDFRGVTR
jgi:hypothetical protein